MIKVEDVADVLTEANGKAAEAILLFCQVNLKLPLINQSNCNIDLAKS
jgi:hypothetical protein